MNQPLNAWGLSIVWAGITMMVFGTWGAYFYLPDHWFGWQISAHFGVMFGALFLKLGYVILLACQEKKLLLKP